MASKPEHSITYSAHVIDDYVCKYVLNVTHFKSINSRKI